MYLLGKINIIHNYTAYSPSFHELKESVFYSPDVDLVLVLNNFEKVSVPFIDEHVNPGKVTPSHLIPKYGLIDYNKQWQFSLIFPIIVLLCSLEKKSKFEVLMIRK